MKRKQKNDLLLRFAETMDNILATGTLQGQAAALTISLIQEVDAGLFKDPTKRKYQAMLTAGSIKLEEEAG